MAKKINEKKEAWFRIIVAIISGVVLTVWRYLIVILSVINWFIAIFSGKRNKELALFCEYWNTESYRFRLYLTFMTNERPFPFTKMEKMSKFK